VKTNLKDEEYKAIRSIYDECLKIDCKPRWGRGAKNGSFSMIFPGVSKNTVISVFSEGTLQFPFSAFNKTMQQKKFIDELKNKIETQMSLIFPEDYEKRLSIFTKDYWITQVPDLLNVIREMKKTYTECID
jgi:hypothetical protein